MLRESQLEDWEEQALLIQLGGKKGVDAILNKTTAVDLHPLKLTKLATVVCPGCMNFLISLEILHLLNIGDIGPNFRKYFLETTEVVTSLSDVSVAFYALGSNASDRQILAWQKKRAKIGLSQFLGLIGEQSQGQEGNLLTNGCCNIAYVRKGDRTWAIDCKWSVMSGCWFLEANPLRGTSKWNKGHQIVAKDA